MDRRNFFKTSCVLCGLGVTGSALLLDSCSKQSTSPQGPSVNFTIDISQASYAALNNIGGIVALNGVIIMNLNNNYVALAQACTHAGCAVNYNSAANKMVCPCHGGTFDTAGNVLSGPPSSPLKKYTVTKLGTVLTVNG